MIIDHLSHCERWFHLGPLFEKAFRYLQETDWQNLESGKYAIEGDRLFAIVQEYETKAAAGEQMESHRTYTDIQYLISGSEQMGLSIAADQTITRPYNPEDDYQLYGNSPDNFVQFHPGMFAVFYPTDLHAPCLHPQEQPVKVKKVVIKVMNV